jgi:multidrug resistance efflux pump
VATGNAPALSQRGSAEHAEPQHVEQPKPRWPWVRYVTPIAVVLLAAALILTLTRNWNAWEGGRVEQLTDDAYVRGDLTPLSTKVPGIVRTVNVSDYQHVHAGDLLVDLEDADYKAQVAQATAAVEAAKAAIENNRRQRELQDSKVDRALAGIDLSKAQIAAAQAGINAVQADVTRTRSERARQEALLTTSSTTKQHVETAVADDERSAAQLTSRQADLEEAKTSLRSNELAVEAERRTKAVLESQEQQLVADLHAKEAAQPGLHKDSRTGGRHRRRTASAARPVAFSGCADFDVRCYQQMGSGQLPGNPAHTHEGRRSCGNSCRRLPRPGLEGARH